MRRKSVSKETFEFLGPIKKTQQADEKPHKLWDAQVGDVLEARIIIHSTVKWNRIEVSEQERRLEFFEQVKRHIQTHIHAQLSNNTALAGQTRPGVGTSSRNIPIPAKTDIGFSEGHKRRQSGLIGGRLAGHQLGAEGQKHEEGENLPFHCVPDSI